MDNILIEYRNRQEVIEDSKIAYNTQVNKIKNYYENGQIGEFGALVCYIYAFLVCLFLSVFYQIKYIFAKYTYKATCSNLPSIHHWTEEERERLDILDKVNNYNDPVEKAITVEKPTKLTQGECATYLRKELIKNDNILKGTVLMTTFPKITGEELLQVNITGNVNRPFIVQRVTFGNKINKALKILYPKLKNRKIKGQEDTYIVFEGDEVFELEKELRNLFMQPVTINLRAN